MVRFLHSYMASALEVIAFQEMKYVIYTARLYYSMSYIMANTDTLGTKIYGEVSSFQRENI